MGYVIRGQGDIVPAPEHRESSIVVVNDAGSPYPLGMVMPSGESFCYADSYSDLVCALIPDYAHAKTEEDKAYLRIVLADNAAVRRQADILAQLDVDEVSDGDWATLNAPKTGEGAPEGIWWRSDIPLILVTTTYQPFTGRLRPGSKKDGVQKDNAVWWVDPTDEETLLTTLHEIGYVRVMSNLDFESVMLYEA